MLPRHLIIGLGLLWLAQQVPRRAYGLLDLSELFYAFHDRRANLSEQCDPNTRINFDQECLILRIFNRTQVDEMDQDTNWSLAMNCACYLGAMRELWDSFDDKRLRRLGNIVKNAEQYEDLGWSEYPDWLWSDVDVTIHQVSIFTATRDFFYMQAHNKSMTIEPAVRRELEKDQMWTLTRHICWRIAQDPHGLYRYAENLNRLNAVIFFGLVKSFQWINSVYTASKACKVLLLHRLPHYKLKPNDWDYIPVYQNIGMPESERNDVDLQLTDTSIQLQKCNLWIQNATRTIEELNRECPMVATEKVSTDWLLQHPSLLERAEIALKCGCHLLKHSATWNLIMQDTNVIVMAKAVTGYMNRNPLPDFSTSPIWTIFGWFEETMKKFKSRQFSIDQLTMVQRKSEDPLEPVEQSRKDALEILRRGCNYVVFNYNRNVQQKPALKLIKYLDNLREIGQDSTFVFHLTLQDINLFKLYALSKMCKSVI